MLNEGISANLETEKKKRIKRPCTFASADQRDLPKAHQELLYYSWAQLLHTSSMAAIESKLASALLWLGFSEACRVPGKYAPS